MNIRKIVHRAILTGAFCGLAFNASADYIYNNSTPANFLGTFDPGTLEVGDEIVLGGTARYLTNFSFEFWSTAATPGTFAGDVQARVRFYNNDGTLFENYKTPGTVFYDSEWFSIGAQVDRKTLLYEAGKDWAAEGLLMPVVSNMTWTVQFQGMGEGDRIGLDIFYPPSVGTDYTDYWQNDGGAWSLKTNLVTVGFGSRFEASVTAVPEPTVLAILAPAALLVFGMRRRGHGRP